MKPVDFFAGNFNSTSSCHRLLTGNCVGVELIVMFVDFQTEIAKRLNAICAQIIPFLSQDVSSSLNPFFGICSVVVLCCFHAQK